MSSESLMTFFVVDSKWNVSESATTMTQRKKVSTFFSQTNQTFQLGLYKANRVNRNATMGTAVLERKKIAHIIARRELKCKHIKSDVKQKVKYGWAVQAIAMEKVWGQRWIGVLPENDFDFEIEAAADIELYIWTNQQMNRNCVLHCAEVWLPTRIRFHCALYTHGQLTTLYASANESRFINHLCRVNTGIFNAWCVCSWLFIKTKLSVKLYFQINHWVRLSDVSLPHSN